MSNDTTQNTDATPSLSPEGNSAVQLQLSDLLLAAQVVQVASQRGAFKPEEFTQIGGLYDRLVAFLQASGAIKQQEAPADGTSAESADSTPAE
jgi:hypothetical protein